MDSLVRFSQGSAPLTLLLGLVVTLATAEALWPRRPGAGPGPSRWANNAGLLVINAYVQALLALAGALPMALLAAQKGWGLFHLLSVPAWAAIPLAVAAMDLAFYGRHRLLHALPGLWRIHQVHHDDRAVDVSTGFRFHPLEAALDLLSWAGVTLLLGAPAASVALTKLLAIGINLLQHANLAIPARLDVPLRRVVITPDMHRIHHSVRGPEADSNYGVLFPWWDRLFGTYRPEPRGGHRGMTLGITGRINPRLEILPGQLLTPFLESGNPNPGSGERRAAPLPEREDEDPPRESPASAHPGAGLPRTGKGRP